jgi:hypothetical protein
LEEIVPGLTDLVEQSRSWDPDFQSMLFNLILLQATIDEGLLNRLVYNDRP